MIFDQPGIFWTKVQSSFDSYAKSIEYKHGPTHPPSRPSEKARVFSLEDYLQALLDPVGSPIVEDLDVWDVGWPEQPRHRVLEKLRRDSENWSNFFLQLEHPLNIDNRSASIFIASSTIVKSFLKSRQKHLMTFFFFWSMTIRPFPSICFTTKQDVSPYNQLGMCSINQLPEAKSLYR